MRISPPAPLIRCENLVKIYKDREADIEVMGLQGLDLEVQQGEMLAIVGRSGSGKTTLLNLLGALDQPSAGRCIVAQHDLSRMREPQRNEYRRFITGHMWQQSGRNLFPDLNLIENVNLPQTLAGIGRSARASRSQRLLDAVGLNGMEQYYPRQLSGGEQQRGAIAVALANEPLLLLADEPTGELDSQTAQDVLGLLRRLCGEWGLTALLVTHDPAIAALADRTIAIRDGRASTETVRRDVSLGDGARAEDNIGGERSASIGPPTSAYRETILVDHAGRLQLPEAALRHSSFGGRADLRIAVDHVELWPVGAGDSSDATPASESAVIGLPASAYHEMVVMDHAGFLQLSEEALDRLPFGRQAEARVLDGHIELWPVKGHVR
jgi:ABC-type lipoprotein export system ATPase subunit